MPAIRQLTDVILRVGDPPMAETVGRRLTIGG